MYPKSTFSGMVPECSDSYRVIMKSVMKVKSAYRNALRKLTREASKIRKALNKTADGAYFSMIREGGSQKYIKYLKLSGETKRMFEDECEEKVGRSEIIMKLRAAYMFRQQNGLEENAPSSNVE